MSGPLCSGSTTQRVSECGAPEAAAEAGEPWQEPDRTVGFPAHRGTLIHGRWEQMLTYRPALLPDIGELINELEVADVIPFGLEFDLENVELRARAFADKVAEEFPADDYNLKLEKKRAFSPYGNPTVGFTGYEADAGGHRNYEEVDDGDIALTTDLEAWPEFDGGTIVNVDGKTGRRENVTPARHNMQGLSAACAIRYGTHQTAQVRRGEKPDPIRFELWFVGEDGSIEVDGWTYSDEEIEAAAVKLCDTAKRITSGYWPPVVGEHCTKNWCSYRRVCPAQGQALATISKKPVIIEPGAELAEVTNNAQALKAIAFLPGVKKLIKELESSLKDYSADNEITREEDDKKWEAKESPRFSGLTESGMVMLAELTADDGELDELAPRKLNRSALKGLGKEREAEIMKAISDAGGIVETTTTRYGWRK